MEKQIFRSCDCSAIIACISRLLLNSSIPFLSAIVRMWVVRMWVVRMWVVRMWVVRPENQVCVRLHNLCSLIM